MVGVSGGSPGTPGGWRIILPALKSPSLKGPSGAFGVSSSPGSTDDSEKCKQRRRTSPPTQAGVGVLSTYVLCLLKVVSRPTDTRWCTCRSIVLCRQGVKPPLNPQNSFTIGTCIKHAQPSPCTSQPFNLYRPLFGYIQGESVRETDRHTETDICIWGLAFQIRCLRVTSDVLLCSKVN